jgi:hypothetical protein
MEENKKTEKVELSDTYYIKLDGVDREVKMTYGLLQKLCSKFTTVGQIQNLDTDFDLQNYMINELLDERDGNSTRLNPEKNYAYGLSVDEGEKLTVWISEHVANFFISRLENQTKAQKQLEDLIEKMLEKTKISE